VTLLRLGKIYEKKGDFALALSNYQTIIEKHSDGIYIDEALYFRPKFSTSNSFLKKSKPCTKNNIQSKTVFILRSEEKFRQLRGDTNL
jgi:hypothetical protein